MPQALMLTLSEAEGEASQQTYGAQWFTAFAPPVCRDPSATPLDEGKPQIHHGERGISNLIKLFIRSDGVPRDNFYTITRNFQQWYARHRSI